MTYYKELERVFWGWIKMLHESVHIYPLLVMRGFYVQMLLQTMRKCNFCEACSEDPSLYNKFCEHLKHL